MKNLSFLKHFKRSIFTTISLLLIALLIISAPAKAYVLDLNVEGRSIYRGEKAIVEFTMDASIEDYIQIEKIGLILNGRENTSCYFLRNAEELDGCEDVDIRLIEIPSNNSGGYGYGYGYGNDVSRYEYLIEIDTNELQSGDYEVQIHLYHDGEKIVTGSDKITIKSKGINLLRHGSGVCESEWTCSEWTTCTEGTEERTCNLKFEGCQPYPIKKPAEVRLCNINEEAGFEEYSVIEERKEVEGKILPATFNPSISLLNGWSGISIVLILAIIDLLLFIIDVSLYRRKR